MWLGSKSCIFNHDSNCDSTTIRLLYNYDPTMIRLRRDVGYKPTSPLRFDYTIRRYHDAFYYDGSDRNDDLRSIWLRYDYDKTTTKNWRSFFARVESRRMEAGARDTSQSDRSRIVSLYHNCDSTMTRLRYDDTTTHSTTTEVIKITICVRFDCDTTTIRLWRIAARDCFHSTLFDASKR